MYGVVELCACAWLAPATLSAWSRLSLSNMGAGRTNSATSFELPLSDSLCTFALSFSLSLEAMVKRWAAVVVDDHNGRVCRCLLRTWMETVLRCRGGASVGRVRVSHDTPATVRIYKHGACVAGDREEVEDLKL